MAQNISFWKPTSPFQNPTQDLSPWNTTSGIEENCSLDTIPRRSIRLSSSDTARSVLTFTCRAHIYLEPTWICKVICKWVIHWSPRPWQTNNLFENQTRTTRIQQSWKISKSSPLKSYQQLNGASVSLWFAVRLKSKEISSSFTQWSTVNSNTSVHSLHCNFIYVH